MGLSAAGPFEAQVTRIRYFLIPSNSQPGARILCADYSLETDEGLRCAAKSFIHVEHLSHWLREKAERWFRRRGLIPSEVPRDARTALALAKVLPEPSRARASWDSKLRTYLIVNEAFGPP
jgi:hypothetical protein